MNFPVCTLAFIEGIGGPEMLLIMFIILLLFGADRMPDLARGIGKSVREFKKAASGVEDQIREAMEEKPEDLPKKFPPYPPQSAANPLPPGARLSSTGQPPPSAPETPPPAPPFVPPEA